VFGIGVGLAFFRRLCEGIKRIGALNDRAGMT
jgi:hypothetical protein